MQSKTAYFEVRKTPSGFKTYGTPAWERKFKVRSNGHHGNDGDVFALWKWDGERLRIRTCYTGVIPLYFYSDSSRFIVSPSLTTIASKDITKPLDYSALSVFLRLGFYLNDHTPFETIRAIGPGVDFTWPDQPRPDCTYPIHSAENHSLADAKNIYLELFHSSMKKRLPPEEEFALPLSGGRDSRHILFELVKLGATPTVSYTTRVFPPRQTADISIAKEVAGLFNIPHFVVPTHASRVIAERKNNLITDLCADEHSWGLNIPSFLESRYQTIYDGINGGIMFGRIGSQQQIELSRSKELEALSSNLLTNEYSERQFSSILNPGFREELSLNQAKQVLLGELKLFENSPNPLQAFYFWNRLRRETSLFTFGILGDYNVLCPFLDRDLVDFSLSLPPAVSSYAKFQNEAISEGFPEFSAPPIEESMPRMRNIPSSYARRYAFDLFRYSLTSQASELLNKHLLLRQSARTLFNGRLSSMDWIAPEKSIYLLQLEKIASE